MNSSRQKQWDNYILNFFQAAVIGDEDEINMYVKDGSDVNEMHEYDDHEEEVSALMLASENDQDEIVKLLLYHEADISHLTQHFTKAVVYASRQNLSDNLKSLAAAGLLGDRYGNVLSLNKGLTDAVFKGKFDEVKNLLSDPGYAKQFGNEKVWENSLCFLVLSGCPKSLVEHVIESFQIDVNCYSRRGFTPLIAAILFGDVEMIDFLIRKGADVNKTEDLMRHAKGVECRWVKDLAKFDSDSSSDDKEDGVNYLPCSDILNSDQKSPLIFAIWTGKMDVLKHVIMAGGLNENHPDSYERATVLAHAVYAGSMDIINELLSLGLDVNQTNFKNRQTTLFEAVNAEREDVLKRILKAGADINHLDKFGKTALMTAAENGKIGSMKVLLEFGGFDVNDCCVHKPQYSPLMFAAQNKHCACLKLLLDHGADLDKTNADEETAFVIAAEFGDVSCFKCLLEESQKRCNDGDKSELNKNIGKAMNYAARNKDIEVLKLLLPYCEDINALDDCDVTPLMDATFAGRIENMDFLLQNGADLNVQNEDGETSLWFALKNENWSCFDLLIEAGADVNYINDECDSLLVRAAQMEDSEYLQILLETGTRQINTLCKHSGHTPLTSAVLCKRLNNVELLLEYGANVNLPRTSRQTPVMMAVRWPEGLQLLLKAGADVDALDEYEETIWCSAVDNFECLKMLLEDGSVFDNTSTLRKLKSVHTESGVGVDSQWDVRCLKLLFEYGVFDWDWYLHGETKNDVEKIAFAVLNVENIAPPLFKDLDGNTTSLLLEAFIGGHIPTVRYLLANLFLTPVDFITLVSDASFQQKMREKKDDDIMPLFDSVACQPWRLETLSFLAISSFLSPTSPCQKPSRSEKVDTLPLPEILKCKLKFDNEVSKLCPSKWESISILRGGKEEDLLAVTKHLYPREEDLSECDEDCKCCSGQGYVCS